MSLLDTLSLLKTSFSKNLFSCSELVYKIGLGKTYFWVRGEKRMASQCFNVGLLNFLTTPPSWQLDIIVQIYRDKAQFAFLIFQITYKRVSVLHIIVFTNYVFFLLLLIMERYEVVKQIGSGNFGVAKLVKDQLTGELFAVKYIERGRKVSC